MEMNKDLVALVAEYKRLDGCMEVMDDDDPVSIECSLARAAIGEQIMGRVVAEWERQKRDPDAWQDEPLWLTRAIYAVADEMCKAWLDDVQADAIAAATEGNPDYLAHLEDDLGEDFGDFLDGYDGDGMPFGSGDDPLF